MKDYIVYDKKMHGQFGGFFHAAPLFYNLCADYKWKIMC
jgi:hypothetical protein